MQQVRLLIDPPAAGAWNMAVDEALLESAAADGGVPALRLYAWDVPTLSLGYFQSAADRAQHAASLDCPLVRRSSGGGAIVHDRELTYSLALPSRVPLMTSATELYDLVHGSLVATLRQFQVPARVFQPGTGHCSTGEKTDSSQPFLCFQRRSCGDILSGNAKIVGSAQRRKHRAVLQHGSILLAQTASAPELPGIRELSAVALGREELSESWLPMLAAGLNCRFVRADLTQSERERVRQFAAERYESEDYTHRR